MSQELPPNNPRAELEARVTAFILGELPAHEAAALRQAMDDDAKLAALYERLKPAVKLVREAVADAAEVSVKNVPLKLSEDRRQKLLAQFKTVTPKEFVPVTKPRKVRFTLIELVAVVAVMAILAGLMLPSLAKSKNKARSVANRYHLAQSQPSPSAAPELNESASQSGENLPHKTVLFKNAEPAKSRFTSADVSVTSGSAPITNSRSKIILPTEDGASLIIEPLEKNSQEKKTAHSYALKGVESADRLPVLGNLFSSTSKSSSTTGDSLNSPLATRSMSLQQSQNFVASNPLGATGGSVSGGFDKTEGANLSNHGATASVTNSYSGEPEWIGSLEHPDQRHSSSNLFVARSAYPTAEFRPPATLGADGSLGSNSELLTAPPQINITAKFADVANNHRSIMQFSQITNTLGDQSGLFRDGVEVLKSPEITTESGRIAHGEPMGTAVAKPEFKSGEALPEVEKSRNIEQQISPNDFALKQANINLRGGKKLDGFELGFDDVSASNAFAGWHRSASLKAYELSEINKGDGNGTGPNYKFNVAEKQSIPVRSFNDVALTNGDFTISNQEAKRLPVITDADTNFYKLNVVGYVNVTLTNGFNLVTNAVEDGTQAYPQAKTELAKLKKFQDALALGLAQSTVEDKMPMTSMVEVVEHADEKPAENPTLGGRLKQILGGKVTKTARIKVERDVTDVPGIKGHPSIDFDPYFVQTEFEVIQSEKVLDKVIEKLHLDKEWAGQKGVDQLKTSEARQILRKNLILGQHKNSSLVDISVKSDKPEEAAKIANTIAEVYSEFRAQQRNEIANQNAVESKRELAKAVELVKLQEAKVDRLRKELNVVDTDPQSDARTQTDVTPRKPAALAPIPQPEISTSENAFSTFSLNVSDVSFKLAAASLEKGQMPEPANIRSEEFINAFDYRDPEPAPGAPLAFAWERARYPFAQSRDLLRFSVKTAAAGRQPGRPLNLVLLLDNSGSMERADRVQIIHEALRVLASQLQPQDTISVVTFARTARLWVDGLSGSQVGEIVVGLDKITPEGGTNLEEAMKLAYETARRHYLANGVNRVVLLTDGAANLGNVEPELINQKVEASRKEGIALDCFGIGWEGYNDDLLEVLSRHGDGRYGFINTPEEAASGFARQLAGALNVAASDVKVQVEFNPKRVTAYRQVGYAKHQLTKEQFRDNTVDAAEIGAAESGNALYVVDVNPNGEGPIATVRVRYKEPGTSNYPEHEWPVPYVGNAISLEQASAAMRLAGAAGAFSEWLASSPFAGEVTADPLLNLIRGVPEIYGADERPKKLEWMIRQAKSLQR